MVVPSSTALATRLAARLGFLRPGAGCGPRRRAAARAADRLALGFRRLGLLGVLALGLYVLSLALGLSFGLALGFGLGFRFRLFLLRAGEVALVFLVGLEVRLVPAGALQAKDRRRDQLLQLLLAAGGALGQRFIADLLHHLEVELAGLAFVFVERHSALC